MLQLPTNTTTGRHFTKAEIADITRNAGALMDFCSYIVETGAVWNGDVPKLLARAREVLAKG